MISCTDKTGFSSLDFLSVETIDNCFAFSKMRQQDQCDLSKNWRAVLGEVSAKHSIAGYVVYENKEGGDILASSLGIAPGGYLYITNDYVMMIWSSDTPAINFHLKKGASCNVPISSFLPTGYLSTTTSRLVGAPPSGVCFINELTLESYDGSLVPVGMLKCDRAIVNNGTPVAYFGCCVGNLPCEPIASGVVGARVAILKGSRTFVQDFKKMKSNEGVYLSGTKRQAISEIYRRLSAGLEVDFSTIRKSTAPASLSYSVASSLGMLQTRTVIKEGDTFFYMGQNVTNAIILINEGNASLSDGVLSYDSQLADLLSRYDAVVNAAKKELLKGAIANANNIFEQVEALLNGLSSSLNEQVEFQFNDVSYQPLMLTPKINVEDRIELSRGDLEAQQLASELQRVVDLNKDFVNRVRYNDGSFRSSADIQSILDDKIRSQVKVNAQQFLDRFNAALLQGAVISCEHDTYSHDKSCDGTHYKKIPSIGHDEAMFIVLNNTAPYTALLNNHLVTKDGVITKIDALTDKEGFKDAIDLSKVRVEKTLSGYQLVFEFKANLLQSCSPLFTLDRQIAFNKSMFKNALANVDTNASIVFLGIEESKLPTKTRAITCDSCGHTHTQYQGLTNSSFAQAAYVQRYAVRIPLTLARPVVTDIEAVGNFEEWYRNMSSNIQTQALLAGSSFLISELCKLNLEDGLRFVGRVGGYFTSFRNLRIFSSLDAAEVLVSTINSIRDVIMFKDEVGVFVVGDVTREALNSAISLAVQDADKAGVYIKYDSNASKYVVVRVNPVVQAWYCDSTCVISESDRCDDLLPILMSM